MAVGVRDVGIDIRARDMASGAFRAVGQSMQGMSQQAETAGQKVSTLGRITDTVGKGIGIAFGFSLWGQVTKGIAFAKESIIGYNQRLQDSTAAMVALSGDAKGVGDMIQRLTAIANNSPFELPGLLQSSQMLVGLGFELEKIPGMMTAIGNTAAATGGANVMEKINSLTQGFVRMQAAGRVTGEVMEVMRNSGVPALDWLAKGFGVTSLEMQKMISKGVVPADKAMAIMLEKMQTEYGGVAEAQAKTFTGAMSTVKDAGAGVIATMFEPLFQVITKVLYAFGQFIQLPGISNFANAFAAGLEKVFDTFAQLFDLMGGMSTVTGVVKVVTGTLGGLVDEAQRLAGYFGTGGLGMVVRFLKTDLQLLRIDAVEPMTAVAGGLRDGLMALADKFKPLEPIIVPLAGAAGNLATQLGILKDAGKPITDLNLDVVFDGLSKSVSALVDVGFGSLAGIMDTISGGLAGLADSVPGLNDTLAGLSSLASGVADAFRGIVNNDPSQIIEGIKGAISGLGGTIAGIFTDLDDIGPKVAAFVASVQAKFDELSVTVMPALEGAVTGATTSFVEELPKMLDAIGPVFQTLISKYVNLGYDIQIVISEWAMKLVDWIAPAIPGLLAALANFGHEMFDWFITQVPVIADKVMAWGTEMVDWITARIPDALVALSGFAQSLFDWIINEGVPQMAAAVGPMFLKFVDWVFDVLPKLLDALDQIIGAILNFIVTNGPVLIGKLLEWAIAFVGWIATEVVPRLIENLPTILRVILLFLGGALMKIGGKALEIGGTFIRHLFSNIGKAPEMIKNVLIGPGGVLSKVVSFAGDIAGKALSAGANFVRNLLENVISLPGKIWGHLAVGPESVMGKLGTFMTDMALKAASIGSGFIRGLLNTLKELPGRLWNSVIGAIRNLFRGGFEIGPLRITLNGIFFAGNKVASFAVGAWNVPSDMPAYVHAGEMIIPSDIASMIRSLASQPRTQAIGARVGFAPRAVTNAGPMNAGPVGGGLNLTIINNFGRDSVRSDDDIRRIGVEMQERAQLLGFTPTMRQVGRATV